MASVKKHLPVLKLIQSAKPKLRKTLISQCELDLIRTIEECIYNTLRGTIPITEETKKSLKKFKNVLRKVLNTKGGLCQKRKVIVQSGGAFLPHLLLPIVEAAEYIFNSEK